MYEYVSKTYQNESKLDQMKSNWDFVIQNRIKSGKLYQ